MSLTIPSLLHSNIRRALLGLAAGSMAVLCTPGSALAASAASGQSAPAPNPQAADEAHKTVYLQAQWQRLSKLTDRDSLIAAELIGWQLPAGSGDTTAQAAVRDQLLRNFGKDPLVLFTLALGCQARAPACSGHEYFDSLVRAAPGNAVHWLMLPDAAAPSVGQLHSAASAPVADSHLPELMRILRAALEDSPIRHDSVDAVPLPSFAGVGALCRAPGEQQRADCIELGRKLLSDRSGAIVPRMVGSAMLRRLLKGTPEAAAATERRREYVWLSEKLPDDKRSDENMQRDAAAVGEWEAWLRLADRTGTPRTPPAGWAPAEPRLMQLWEDRTPASK
jgi:hypothetical protein